jgi:RNA polymerase sigma-70 factor (ECF subfamily)
MTDYDVKIVASLASRGWLLTHPDGDPDAWRDMVTGVHNALASGHRFYGPNESAIDRAVTYAYCPILLAACREDGSDRQERAFEEIWHWLYPRVYARINHPQDAEDVAQQVLVKVYQNLHQVREPHGFLGWVSVIMRRELIDYYWRKGRLDQLEEEKSEENGDNGDGDGMDNLAGPDSFLETDVDAAEEELIRMIYSCMPKKNMRRAEVLVALTLLGQTVAEVAESLQISANAVYLLYFQAKKDLPKHCPELIEFLLQQLAPSWRLSTKEGNS